MPELHTTKPEPKRHDFAAGETGRGPSVPSNGLANDPKAGQWDGRRMSKRMIADYNTFIVTDGEGVRNSLTSPVAPSTASTASTPPSGISKPATNTRKNLKTKSSKI